MKDVLFHRKWLWANGYLYAGTEKYKGEPIDVPCLQEAETITGIGWYLYYTRRNIVLRDIFAPDPDRRF